MSEAIKAKTSLVKETAAKLLGMLSADSPTGKSLRPLFRRAFASGEKDLETLGWMLEHMPEEITGHSGHLSNAEEAIYLTLCIFAECRGRTASDSLFAAAAKTGVSQKRLAELEYAGSLEELKMPLCMLIKYIKSKGYDINYVDLAMDLYHFRYSKDQVIRNWARQYSSTKYASKKGE